MGAIKIAGTTVIDSNKKFIGTSIDVSGNSDANAFRVNGTTVIDSGRKLTNIADGSGELSLSGNTLALTIGGTQQDTQTVQAALSSNQKLRIATGRCFASHAGIAGTNTSNGLTWSNGGDTGSDVAWVGISFNVGTLYSLHADICSTAESHAYLWWANTYWLTNTTARVYLRYQGSGSWGSGSVHVCATAIGI